MHVRVNVCVCACILAKPSEWVPSYFRQTLGSRPAFHAPWCLDARLSYGGNQSTHDVAMSKNKKSGIKSVFCAAFYNIKTTKVKGAKNKRRVLYLHLAFNRRHISRKPCPE